MSLHPRSLRVRIALLVGILAMAAASLASLAALSPMRQQMQGLVGHQEMAVVSNAAAALDKEISAKRLLLRAIAETAGCLQQADARQLQRLLEQHAVLREEFDNVVVFDPTGQVIANLGAPRAVGDRSAGRSKALRNIVENRKGVVSPAFRSPLSGKPAIMLGEPVLAADGSVAFVLGGGLSLVNARFMGQFKSSLPATTAYFFLIDERGTIIYHPIQSRILENVWHEPGGVTDLTRQAMGGFEGWTTGVTKEGKHALVATTHLRQTGWTLALVYPVAEAFATLRESEAVAWQSVALVTMLAVALGLWWTAFLLRPLHRLQRRVELLSAGDAAIEVLDSRRPDEIGSLSRAFFALSQQRQDAEARLALLSRTDTLTGLHNRRMFEAELPAALARARRHDGRLALAFFDVDHFKQINDTFGHATGDEVLVEFARRLRSSVREVDIVARLSGDEFVIIFEQMDSVAAIGPMMADLLVAIRQPFACGAKRLSVTTTVGVAYGGGTLRAEQILHAADEALYEAKAAGRDTWALRRVGDWPRPAPILGAVGT